MCEEFTPVVKGNLISQVYFTPNNYLLSLGLTARQRSQVVDYFHCFVLSERQLTFEEKKWSEKEKMQSTREKKTRNTASKMWTEREAEVFPEGKNEQVRTKYFGAESWSTCTFCFISLPTTQNHIITMSSNTMGIKVMSVINK